MCGNITSSGVYADNQKDPDLIKKFNTNETVSYTHLTRQNWNSQRERMCWNSIFR